MKTTIELPDELARRVKRRAVERDQKLKDTVAQLLGIGLANVPDHTSPEERLEARSTQDTGTAHDR